MGVCCGHYDNSTNSGTFRRTCQIKQSLFISYRTRSKESKDLVVYESPFDPANKPTCLNICEYDTFGFHSNTKEFCDNLTMASGTRVIMPDFYRVDYWNEECYSLFLCSCIDEIMWKLNYPHSFMIGPASLLVIAVAYIWYWERYSDYHLPFRERNAHNTAKQLMQVFTVAIQFCQTPDLL